VESSSVYDNAFINKHASMKHFVATSKQYWHLEGIGNNDCTKITYLIQVNLGGFIPHQFINRGAVGFLNDWVIMRKHFSRYMRASAVCYPENENFEHPVGATTFSSLCALLRY